MAVLYIAEYSSMAQIPGTDGQMPEEPCGREQVVPIGAAAQSAILDPSTRFVRLHADAPCSILFGDSDPINFVNTGNQRFARDQTECKAIHRANLRVAVIANA